jgi:hypothetical protein
MSLLLQRTIRVVVAAAVVIGGYAHYHLYQDVGYKHTPVGSAFLLDFVASLVVGVLLLVGPRRIVAFLGTGLAFVTLLAFVLSRGPGVPTFSGVTFKESGLTPQTVHLLGVEIALLVIIVESVAIVLGAVLLLAPKPSTTVISRRAHAAA